MIEIKTITALAVAAVLLSGCETYQPQEATRSAVPFRNMYFSPTNGRVGYHFEAVLFTPTASLPAGYGPGRQQCDTFATGFYHEGVLPPGITYTGKSPVVFSGTPRQAGRWTITAYWQGPHCRMGHDQTRYPDVAIPVTFTIDP